MFFLDPHFGWKLTLFQEMKAVGLSVNNDGLA